MSEYTKDMTISEMRKEIALMLECGEGFISSREKLLEYVDDFIKKIRADIIDEFVKKMGFCCDSKSCYSEKKCFECGYNIISEKEVLRIAEKLKEQKNG